MTEPFHDRAEAGRVLAEKLAGYTDRPNVIVLALSRGGAPVAFEVACALRAPLDVFLVRKLGVPGREELAMGAIATGGVRIVNRHVVKRLGIRQRDLDSATAREWDELHRREREYRDGRPVPNPRGRTVILIDDGLATGITMRSAVVALRRQKPGRLVVAVPVAALETCEQFQNEVDEAICVRTPKPFHSVGTWYDDFTQTTDAEVRDLLARASARSRRKERSAKPDQPRTGAL
ncbi:MAG: phosphoribosyltransferase [Isosphaeraceae bacterium]